MEEQIQMPLNDVLLVGYDFTHGDKYNCTRITLSLCMSRKREGKRILKGRTTNDAERSNFGT